MAILLITSLELPCIKVEQDVIGWLVANRARSEITVQMGVYIINR